MSHGENQILSKQVVILQTILKKDPDLWQLITAASALNIPNLYVGGGSLAQSVWNHLFHKSIGYGFSDVDIVYFDGDLSEEKEKRVRNQISAALSPNRYDVDVKNEARVHLWYQAHFGMSIKPYSSTEDAISSWPSTATALGVYLDKKQKLQVFAPYGMNDIYKGIMRPNKQMITKAMYDKKVTKWSQKWPELDVKEW